jgi:hypothetical protein
LERLPMSGERKSWAQSELATRLLTGLVLVLGGAAVAGVLWWSSASSAPRLDLSESTTPAVVRTDPGESGRYVGAASCRECHPGECALFARSGHARTLRPAASNPIARRLDGRTIADPEQPGVEWSYHLRDDRFSVERREGMKVETLPIEFSFGSGQMGTTFVTTFPSHSGAPPTGIEHRLSYRDAGRKPVITPGQRRGEPSEPGSRNTPSGRLMEAFPLLRCFSCHVTAPSVPDRQGIDTATMIPNVTCERCHGPAGAHVEAARRGGSEEELLMPLGPDRASPPEQIAECGACHRTPDAVEPGTIRPDNLSIVRFQPIGLVRSKCFQMGRSGLRCTSCHDPHARLSRDTAAYEAVCLDCHRSGGPAKTLCPVSSIKDCVACHMPRREVISGALFTDHWIRVHPEGAEAAPSP